MLATRRLQRCLNSEEMGLARSARLCLGVGGLRGSRILGEVWVSICEPVAESLSAAESLGRGAQPVCAHTHRRAHTHTECKQAWVQYGARGCERLMDRWGRLAPESNMPSGLYGLHVRISLSFPNLIL